MKSRWSDADAEAAIVRWGPRWGPDLALRAYSSQLIGAEDDLVLHGGGNTSCKGTVRTILGDEVEAVFVKGSGWDLASIEPQGFPGVALEPMRRLLRVPNLSDEDMVQAQRAHMFDASAPNPSIEALLHAFFPAKFVDHSHADAILALTNHPEGAENVLAALGDGVCLVPYVKPGFDLAVLAAEAFAAMPGCTSMVLLQHGLFTWGETAREAYEHHIELVSRAEAWVAARALPKAPRPDSAQVATARERAARLAPLLRGALGRQGKRWIVSHRVDAELLGQVNDPRLDRWVEAGPLTPDHVIRTKPKDLVVRVPHGDEAGTVAAIEEALTAYRAAYQAMFDRQSERVGGGLKRLDDLPRALAVPGVGLFAVGSTPKDARIVLDITAHTFAVKEASEGLGPFEGPPEDPLFDVEYWSLEQAKLGKGTAKVLAGQVALVTGGAGAIGVGIARKLREAGANVVIADLDEDRLNSAVGVLGRGPDLLAVRCDVTQEGSVQAAFEAAALAYGGVDIVVPNAGIAHVAPLVELQDEAFRKVMEVNAHGVFLTLREAGRQLIRQGTGGHIVVISSKNVLGPGASFGAYSASKAAAHQLARVAALELAPHRIAVNLVTPDAVFSQDGVESGLWATVGPDRAASKGLSTADLPEHYRQRNLLRATVTGAHVGNAVVFFASGATPTTGAVLPVDGGVETAFPR